MRLWKNRYAALALVISAVAPAHAQSSSVFDGTNADLWLVDAAEGRVTGYDLGGWLEQFAPGGNPVFPLEGNQQALINVLGNSSQPMTPNQPAISIAGIDAGRDGNNPDGHSALLVLPASGSYGATIAVEMRVDTALMAADRPTLNWTIDGGPPQSLLLSQDLLDKPGAAVSNGYYTVFAHIARSGSHTLDVTLTEPGPATLASETRSYTLTPIAPEGDGRDSDGDGIPDVVEVEIGLDPLSDDWLEDADGDGWSEFDAWLRTPCLDPATQAVQAATNCLDADGKPVDSDSDGWSDFDEIVRGTNHLDPEPVLPGAAAAPVSKGQAPALAPSMIESAAFCTDGSTFFFDLRFYAEADDAQLFDVILGVGADGYPFQTPNHSIRVNFGEQGQITRQDPIVRTSSTSTETPLERWQTGPIDDFTIDRLAAFTWHVYGSVPVGSAPFAPGDAVSRFVIRSGVSGETSGANYVVSGDPADCAGDSPPPANGEPTALRYKDFPSARRLYEVEKIVSGTIAGAAQEPLPAQKVEAVTIFGQQTYSTDDLLTADELAAVSLDPADVADRLEAAVAATAIAAGQVPLLRLPVSESNVVMVEHRSATPPADYSRIYKLWISQLPDATPRDFFAQPGQPVYGSAAEWRDAFVAWLVTALTVDVSPVQLDLASTRVVSLVEGALSQESRLGGGRPFQLLSTDFGAVDPGFVDATVEALRRFGGPDYNLDAAAAQLAQLTQPAQPLQALGEWIDDSFLTEAPDARSDGYIAARLRQSYDEACYIESSVVAELQQDEDAWAEFLARCPDYITEIELPAILLADQERRHGLRTAFLPGAVSALAADPTLLEPGTDSDADNRVNTTEINRPLPTVTLPWDADTDGDLIVDGDDLCPVDPYNDCSENPILPGLTIGADVFVYEPASGSGIAIITVVLDRAADVDVTVDYRAFVNTGDTAQGGADFTEISGSVTIAAGERVAIITVPVFADAQAEDPETFTVEITGISGATVADDGIVVVTINDTASVNTPPVFTSPSTASVEEGSTATGYTATAFDADLDALTFSVLGGADQAAFSIDGASGVLSFLSAPVFGSPTDANADNDYEVQLGVSDGNGGSNTLDVVITVTAASGGALRLEVTYPPQYANLGGAATSTIVRGRVVDPAGNPIDPADIDYIDVDGQLATLDAGDPSRWSVRVPVEQGGLFSLPVAFATTDGSTQTFGLVLANFAVHTGFGKLDLDAAGSRILVTDNWINGVLEINVATGERAVLSASGTGSGPNFSSPRDVALDTANGRALVVDWPLDALFAVDLATGNRSIVSNNSNGSGPALDGAQSLSLDASGNLALVAITNGSLVIGVDLATGDRTLISGGGTGGGPAFVNLRAVTVDAVNERAFAIDSNLDAVLSVNLATGDRTIISDAATGTGQTFSSPEEIVLDAANNRVLVTDQTRGLIAVDIASGNRTLIDAPTADYGVNGSRVTGVAYEPGSGTAYVSDHTVDAIFAIDVATGDRTIVSDSATGTVSEPAVLFGIQGIAFDSADNRLLVNDSYKKVLWSLDLGGAYRSPASSASVGTGIVIDFPGKAVVDPAGSRLFYVEMNRNALTVADLLTGDRSDVSSAGIGAGPAFAGVRDVAVDSIGNRALVVDGTADALIAVDLATGDRTVVSDAATGTGPVFSVPDSIAYDASGNRALVMDWDTDTLLAVDLASGNRTALSNNTGVGTGTNFSIPYDMAFDAAGNRALVVDYGTDTLTAVDLTTGDRSEVSGAAAGSGVSFLNPYYIALDADNQRAFIYDVALTGIIVVDLSTGERAVAAK